MIATGQVILGTDKRNALFTVYEWEKDDGEEQLQIYYGLELLEVLPADRNAPSFKMLVGRLYDLIRGKSMHNAGTSQALRTKVSLFVGISARMRAWLSTNLAMRVHANCTI